MKWLAAVMTMLCLLVGQSHAVQRKAKSLSLADGDVGEVKTALGYSTILQFDSRPTSVVLGDQDAFKVEYVGDGLTLKPLVPGSRTNLFVFTDYDRFNFRVVTASADQAEYLVKVSRPRAKSYPVEVGGSNERMREIRIGKTAACESISLTLDKMGSPSSGNYLVLTFRLRNNSVARGRELNFSPGDLELIQNKKMVPIENLYLDGLSFSKGKPTVRGTLVAKKSDLRSNALALVGFSASFLKTPKCLRASFQPMN